MDILKADDLETVVRRENRKLPPKPYGILESFYRQRLVEVSKITFFLFLFRHFLRTEIENSIERIMSNIWSRLFTIQTLIRYPFWT